MQRLVGMQAPDFSMQAAMGDGETTGHVSLSDYKGKWLVLFFYPLDFTFVWPTELKSMGDRLDVFKKFNAEVLGVSTDSVFSHNAWMKGDLGTLPYPLASDMTHQVSKDYGVYLEDMGVALRGTFIIDPDGIVKYSSVNDLGVGRSTNETLRVLQALQAGGLCPADWGPGDELL